MLHPIQKSILTSLAKNAVRRFSEMNVYGLSHDKFNYHLRTLLDQQIVEKTDKGYVLSIVGKKEISRLNLETQEYDELPQTRVQVIPYKIIHDEYFILAHQRKTQPHYDKVGFIVGKVSFSETLDHTLERILKKSVDITVTSKTLVGIHHKQEYIGEVAVTDTFFYVFAVPVEEIFDGKVSDDRGDYFWIPLKKLPEYSLFEGIKEVVLWIENPSIILLESRYVIKEF